MATSRLNLTRDQLATFLKDHESIRQFERLFATVDEIAPDFVNEVAVSAGNAQATANDALALIAALENSLTADGAVTDAKATLALQELQALKAELQLKALEPAQQYNNAIVTDYLTINEHGNGENAVGRMVWDDGDGTISLGLKGGNVECKIGEQEYARAYNDTASTMTKGQVVYISGAQGNRVAVKLAKADSDVNSAHTIGFVAETIAAGAEGWVQISGPIYKINTLGTTAGDTVYLSPTTFGAWTTTKPLAPDHLVVVGFIERVSATVGSIFIKVDNGYELDELHNVRITSVADKDLLQYDSTGPYWKNVAASSIPIGTATNLAGGGAGSVPYQTAASTTTFLPIGTATQVLKTNAGATAPEWASGAALTKVDDTNVTLTLGGTPASALLAAASLTLGWTGQLGATRGGTGQGTYTLGDTLYSSAANTLAKLPGNTTTTRQFLRQTGTGTVSAAPAWDTVTKTDVGLSNVENTALSTWGGSANITTLGTVTTGTWSATAIAATRGGTGQTSYVVGDILYASSTTALSRLADVATGNALISGGVGVAPSWGKIGLTTHVSGTLAAGNGGTGIAAYATGDLLYASSPSTLARLASAVTGLSLISSGAGVAPAWGKIGLTTHVSGTLPVGNGGTGTATAFTPGSVVFAGTSGVYSQDNTNFFWDDTNKFLGLGTSTPTHILTASAFSQPSTTQSYVVAKIRDLWGYADAPEPGILFSGYTDATTESALGSLSVIKNNATSGDADSTMKFVVSSSTPGVHVTAMQIGSNGYAQCNGLQFPATQAASADANCLDDYEEGNWTPTIVGGTVAGAGTYTTQVGRYTKIGRDVTITGRVTWTAHTGTGTMRIGGLPFTSMNVAGVLPAVTFGYINNVVYTAANTPMGYVNANTTQIILVQMPSGGGAMANVNMDAAGDYIFACTYMV